ncbi:hypothetical protein E4665_02365 [Sporolactobacillus shoreae]|uniref:Uncharacterized protein n=1 Tax=Sporolactobacillus shoreae TaxID=1465501 RepID=A0A4Z0GU26_9BACL|nr:hypothetical protein [Sporolactobacillus shoreae]TGA99812.1 hypothetical protein E4665_02365 [Sporolactobacillus shoreae]
MGLLDDLAGIEMKIADAALNKVDDAIISALKAEQKALKKQWQRMELQRDIQNAFNRIIEDKRQSLYRHKNLIEELGRDLTVIHDGLQDAFESRTGSAISERLNEEKARISGQYQTLYDETLASCRINLL